MKEKILILSLLFKADSLGGRVCKDGIVVSQLS